MKNLCRILAPLSCMVPLAGVLALTFGLAWWTNGTLGADLDTVFDAVRVQPAPSHSTAPCTPANRPADIRVAALSQPASRVR
jgi:hypothetical protein